MRTKLEVALLVLLILGLVAAVVVNSSAPAGRQPAPAEPGEETMDPGAMGERPRPTPAEVVAEATTRPGEMSDQREEHGNGEEGVVEGQVVDADRRPVGGAEVEVLPGPVAFGDVPGGVWAARLFARPVTAVAAAGSDADGRFRVAGLPAGEHYLRVRAAGYVETTVRAPTGGDPLRIVLSRGQVISGVVVEKSSGVALSGITLAARRPEAPEFQKPHRASLQATSGEDGSFTFTGLSEVEYLIVVGSRYRMEQPGLSDEFVPVTVGPVSAGTRDVRVVLTRGLSISGRIEDDHGDRIAFQVPIDVIALTAAGDPDQTRQRTVWSDSSGAFRITGLPPGDYRLTFTPQVGMFGFGRDSAQAPESAALTVLSDVPAGTEDLRVRLRRGVALEGRLEDERGNPVTGHGAIYVYPTGEHPARGGATALPVDAEGAFKTLPLDPEQSYDILATGFSGHRATVRKGVLPGTPDIVLVLPRASRICGKVLDDRDQPVPAGVGVFAFAPDAPAGAGGSTVTTRTSSDGSFVLDGLGDFAFRIRAGGGQSTFRAGAAIEGVRPDADPVVLRVIPGVSFSGRLVDQEGRPVITNIVRASQPGDAVAPFAAVRDAEGNFTITGLAPGNLTLHALLGSKYVELGDFTAPAEGATVVVPTR